MVELVAISLPQLHLAVICSYFGWVSAFIILSLFYLGSREGRNHTREYINRKWN